MRLPSPHPAPRVRRPARRARGGRGRLGSPRSRARPRADRSGVPRIHDVADTGRDLAQRPVIADIGPSSDRDSVPIDPYRAESGRLVAALAAQPQVLAANAEPLRAALGDHGVDLLLKASARFQANADAHPELRAQIDSLRRTMDLSDPASGQDISGRLNMIFENSARQAPAENLTVADPGGPAKKPLVALGRAGERPAMSAEELEAYVHKNSVTSPAASSGPTSLPATTAPPTTRPYASSASRWS